MSRRRNKYYDRKLKLQAVQDYLGGGGSLRTICKKHGIKDKKQLRNWIKWYNADHGAVQALHHAPHSPALKRLRAGCHQPPKFCQLAIPSGKGAVQIFYDPVLVQGFTCFRIKEMTALLISKTVAVFFHHHTLCG